MTTPTTTAPSSARAVAVDWSGARAGAGRRIWLGEAVPGELLRLEGGRDRAALERHLRELADRAAGPLVVGLDFAFSLPAWFLEERGIDRKSVV